MIKIRIFPQILAMRHAFFIAILIFKSITTFSQTESIYKKYFLENISSLDIVEGIYDCSYRTRSWDSMGNLYFDETITDGGNTTIINQNDKLNVLDENNIAIAYLIKTAVPGKYVMQMKNGKHYLYVTDFGLVKYTIDKTDDDGRYIAEVTLTKLYPTLDDIKLENNKIRPSTGTGFAISKEGYIVTNYHVIEHGKIIKAKGINNNFNLSVKLKVVVVDKNNDLAILKIDDTAFTKINSIPFIINKLGSDVGENIFTLGYPLTATMGEEIKLTNGIISSKSGFQGDVTTYQITAPVQPGNSGAPLFDKNGNLVGVISGKHRNAENVNYAVKSAYLLNLISEINLSLDVSSLNTLQSKTLTDQVKLLKNYVYIIEVN